MKTIQVMTKEMVCANCKHYYQHYVWGGSRRFVPCNSGHCSYPRPNDRNPGQEGCDHFENA